jgi:hypothetical protein
MRIRALAASLVVATVLWTGAVRVGAVAPAKAETPRTWAAAMCPALARFIRDFTGQGDVLTTATSRSELQTNLRAALDSTVDSAENVERIAKHLDAPNVPKGDATKKVFVKQFAHLGDIMDQLSAAIALFDLDAADFDDNATFVVDKSKREFSKSFDAIQAKLDPKVDKALGQDVACQAIPTA